MVSLVNSHTKATRIEWHLWEIDWDLPLGYLQDGQGRDSPEVAKTLPNRPAAKSAPVSHVAPISLPTSGLSPSFSLFVAERLFIVY